MAKNEKNWNAYFIAGLFIIISYIFASWWNWWFGCSFGARSFVEYYSILCFPFCYFLDRTLNHKTIRYLTILLVIGCCYVNMDIEYYYDGCFYGDTWDWATYLKLFNS